MIHKLFNLTRPLFVIDAETTGVNPATDRIVELGFQLWTAEGLTKEWRSLVDPGVPIPAGAAKVHGITDGAIKRCRSCSRRADEHPAADPSGVCLEFKPWPTFRQLAPNLAKGLVNCDFAGKRVRFDLQIIRAEMSRAGIAWHYVGARIVDADRLEQLAVPRTLSDLHEKYAGMKHDGAHGALSDVRASTTVIVKQLEAYEALPRDLDALHQLQWPSFIDAEGLFRFVDGEPTVMFGKYRGKSMRAADAGYWDYVLRQDFADDVKRLAADAKVGKYPIQEK